MPFTLSHIPMICASTTRGCCLCQKLKLCSIFLIYNDVHYHIPSAVIFQKRKGKQTEMTDAPSGDRSSRKGLYNQREGGRRRGSERKNILHRLSVCDGNITTLEAQIVATLSCMCKVVVFSEVITTTPCNRGIAIPVICFGISMNSTRVRRVGGEIRFRRPLGEMTSDEI